MITLASVNSCLPLLVPPPPGTSFESSLHRLRIRLAASKSYERNHWFFEATAATAEMIGDTLMSASSRPAVSTEQLELVRSKIDTLVEVLLSISQLEPVLTCEMVPLTIR